MVPEQCAAHKPERIDFIDNVDMTENLIFNLIVKIRPFSTNRDCRQSISAHGLRLLDRDFNAINLTLTFACFTRR